jgi:hypothetical protein
MRTAGPLALLAVLGLAGQTAAQNLPTVDDARLESAIKAARAEIAPALTAAGTDATKRTDAYRQLLPRVISHLGDEFARVRRETPKAVYDEGLKVPTNTRSVALQRFVAEEPDSASAQSLNAPLTNPGTNQILERSGGTDLFALAADLKQLFSADKSAVTLHLNAFALLGGTNAGGNRSAQYVYGRREGWRRLTGSVTFGAKLPEKEITGITGLPDAEKAFDAIAWDTKVRLIGDRDPRARHWYPLLLGDLGTVTEIAGRIALSPSLSPEEVTTVTAVVDEAIGAELKRANERIANSLQVSVKFSGQHLTQEANRNKYIGAVMLDKGFNGVDLTANLTYGAADAPAMEATDPFKTKDWQYSVGLTGSILKNAIVAKRSVELSLALSGIVPVDDDAIPVDRKKIYKVNSTVSLPFQQKGKIPISITFSNDPNNLKKEKYVSGQIGLSYDLGAIWDAFK